MYPVFLAINLICSLVALFFLRNENRNIWVLLKWFTVFDAFVEFFALVFSAVSHKYNLWVFTLYLPFNFIILYWSVYKLLPFHKYNKFLCVTGIVVFCLCYVTEIGLHGIYVYSINSDTVATIFMIIGCNWFFYLLLQKQEWILISKHAAFWFVTGLFLFSFCTVVTDLFDNELNDLFITNKLPLRSLLFVGFNLILYGCWSYAFICKYQETISL